MFSNGTEYQCFLESQCFDCRFYVHFEEATEKKPVCHIEERIALCGGPGDDFPYEWLEENGYMYRYDCRRRALKKKRFWTADKLPQYAPPMTQEQANELLAAFKIEE